MSASGPQWNPFRQLLYVSPRRTIEGEVLIHRGLTRLRPLRKPNGRSSSESDPDSDGDIEVYDVNTVTGTRGVERSSNNESLPVISVDVDRVGFLERSSVAAPSWSLRSRTVNRRPRSRLEPMRQRLRQAVKTAGIVGKIGQQAAINNRHFEDDRQRPSCLSNRKCSDLTSYDGIDLNPDQLSSLNNTSATMVHTTGRTDGVQGERNDPGVRVDESATFERGRYSSVFEESPVMKASCKSLLNKFRRHAKYLIILRRLCDHHAARLTNYLDESVNIEHTNDQTMELMFDKKLYKSGIRARVSPDFKRILSKPCGTRSNAEVKYVVVALGNYDAFASFPAEMKQQIAARGWYEGHDSRRTIIKEGDFARCVYFILSGEVAVSKMDYDIGKSETLCRLGRNDIFGELGIINRCHRNASIITRCPVELLVFTDQVVTWTIKRGDEDYIDVFMYGGLHQVQNTLLRKLPFLEGWPIDVLTKNKSKACINYFKKGSVLIHNSRYSDWIVVVKSGSCSVLKKLVHPRLASVQSTVVRDGTLSQSVSGVSSAYGRESIDANNVSTVAPVTRELTEFSIATRPSTGRQPQTNEEMDKMKARRHQRALYIENELIGLQFGSKLRNAIRRRSPEMPRSREITSLVPVANATEITAATVHGITTSAFINTSSLGFPLSSTFVQTDPQHKPEVLKWPEKLVFNDIFNTRYFSERIPVTQADRYPQFIEVQVLKKNDVFGLADIIHDDQPALSLISNGAQCVFINKQFYLQHASRSLIARLVTKVASYPSDTELQRNLMAHVDWLKYRERILLSSIDEATVTRVRNKLSPTTGQMPVDVRQKSPVRTLLRDLKKSNTLSNHLTVTI